MALKLNCPSSVVLAGASQIGKTCFIFKSIDHFDEILTEKVEKIIFFYEAWQDVFDKCTGKIKCHQDMLSIALLKQPKHSLVILDDLMNCSWQFLAKLFHSHHCKFIVIFAIQNLFHKALRKITLNAQIVILFKNCRDVNQIANFRRQVFPEKYKKAVTADTDATSQQRGCLLIDFRVKTSDSQRLRTSLFSNETHCLYK